MSLPLTVTRSRACLLHHQQLTETLTAQHQTSVTNRLSQLEVHLTSQHLDDMTRVREGFESELSKRLQEMELVYAERLQDQLQQAEDEWERRTESTRREMAAKSETELKQLSLQHEEEAENSRRAFEQALQSKILELERTHTRELAELTETLERKHQVSMRELEESCQQQISHLQQPLEEQRSLNKEKERSSVLHEHRQQIETMAAEHSRQLKEVRSRTAGHISSLQDEVARLERQLKMVSYQTKQQLEERHTNSLAAVLSQNVLHTATRVEQLRVDMMKEKELALSELRRSLEEQHCCAMGAMKEECVHEQETLWQVKMAELKETMAREHEDKLTSLQQSLQNELVEEKAALQAQLESERLQQMEELVQTLSCEMQTSLQSDLQAKNELIIELQDHLDKGVTTLEQEIAKNKQQQAILDEREQAWRLAYEKHGDELKAAHDHAVTELMEAHQQALRAAQQEKGAKLAAQAIEHAKELATLESECAQHEALAREEFERLRAADQSNMETAVMDELTRVNADLQTRLAQLDKLSLEQTATQVSHRVSE